jgi:1,4-dihydroxy-6-naphthoate synthase
MFYGLATGKVDAGELEIEPVAAPRAALTDRASRGELEVTMISAAAYAYLQDRYVLARCGACFASERGPVLAAREPISESDLARASVAVPDVTSSATLALQLNRPGVRTRLLPADKITQAAKMGLADCALLIDGNSAAFRQSGLYCVADLAVGWARQTGDLPLPLTCLAIRNDLDEPVRLRIESVLRASIRYGVKHRAEAARFAIEVAPNGSAAELDPAALGVCVTDSTVEMDPPGRHALEELLRRGHDADILPNALPLRFVGGGA